MASWCSVKSRQREQKPRSRAEKANHLSRKAGISLPFPFCLTRFGLAIRDIQTVAWRKFAAFLRLAKGAVLVVHLEMVGDRILVCWNRNDSLPSIADSERWPHRKKIEANDHVGLDRASDERLLIAVPGEFDGIESRRIR